MLLTLFLFGNELFEIRYNEPLPPKACTPEGIAGGIAGGVAIGFITEIESEQ